jgi:hypothetical protein
MSGGSHPIYCPGLGVDWDRAGRRHERCAHNFCQSNLFVALWNRQNLAEIWAWEWSVRILKTRMFFSYKHLTLHRLYPKESKRQKNSAKLDNQTKNIIIINTVTLFELPSPSRCFSLLSERLELGHRQVALRTNRDLRFGQRKCTYVLVIALLDRNELQLPAGRHESPDIQWNFPLPSDTSHLPGTLKSYTAVATVRHVGRARRVACVRSTCESTSTPIAR